MSVSPTIGKFVPELNDQFLALFPHRFDFLYASHPKPGESPQWHTQTRHPLADRMIREGALLYGVRFGPDTNYALIDIDKGSIYHPKRDPFAVTRIMAALEPLGLTHYIAVTSSYTEGLHLYLPFDQPVKSWQLAIGISTLLEQAGFKLEPGLLEVFPNPRPYDGEALALYKGHRLPLQAGSYMLSPGDWQLTHPSPSAFVSQWRFCMSKNDVQKDTLKRAIAQSRAKHRRLSHKAAKFLNDLNCDIEPGWTGYGQTNYLLGRIALRTYCFGHLLENCDPFEGDRLVAAIVATALQLPGYADWCRHQHEIWQRAEEWARCVEDSHYWHFRIPKTEPQKPDTESLSSSTQEHDTPGRSWVNTWNAYQQQNARDRIRYALADMLDRGTLPAASRERFVSLTRRGIGGETLYRHRDLWHPEHICPVDNPPAPPQAVKELVGDCPSGGIPNQGGTSLLVTTAGNINTREAYRQFLQSIFQSTGGNTALDKALSDADTPEGVDSG